MKNNCKNNIFLKGTYLLSILYIIWIIFPYFQRNISTQLIIILVLFLIFTFFLGTNIYKIRIHKVYLLVLVWIVIIIIQYLRVSSFVEVGNLYMGILFVSPMFLFFIFKNTSLNQSSNIDGIYIVIMITILIVTVTNIYILFHDPTASKYMTGSIERAVDKYNETNLAALPHIAFISLLLPIYINGCKEKNLFKKTLFYLLTISSSILVFLAGSSITLITVIIQLVLLLIFLKIKRSFIRMLSILSIGFFLVLGVLLRGFIGSYFLELSSTINNDLYSERLEGIAAFLMGLKQEGSLTLRIEDLIISFKSFFSNLFFGKGMIYHNDIHTTGIGMHSQIIDDMARYGLFGYFVFILIIIIFLKTYCHGLSKDVYAVLVSVVGGLIIFSLINIASNLIFGLLLFFVIPIFVERKRKEEIYYTEPKDMRDKINEKQN